MADRRSVDDLSIEELEQVLAIKRRQQRLIRVRQMQENGRLVEPPLADQPPPSLVSPPDVEPGGAMERYRLAPVEEENAPEEPGSEEPGRSPIRFRFPQVNLRWVGDRVLVLIEVAAVLTLVWILLDTWLTRRELNRTVDQVQREIIAENYPSPEPTPLIGVALLPGGHTSPIAEGGARPGEAGGIPEHLLPRVNAYKQPPIPTPGPEQPRRIVIPVIGVDHPIVEGDNWEQLKKGVGHHIGSADPGQAGNLVLTAHNDIYGEIFRYLDKLQAGDEIIIYTLSRRYVYTVQSHRIVDPSQISILEPTRKPTITLISCYPYLVDTNRYIVIGTLEEEL